MKKFKLIKKYPGIFSILNIGDIVTQENINELYSFKTYYSSKWNDAYFEEYPEYWQRVSALFLTEDNVTIFSGDSWWYVVLATLNPPKQTSNYTVASNSEVKRFSTKEAAWRFINKNKNPVLFITEDGKEIRKGGTSFGVRLYDFKLMPATHFDTTFYSSHIKEFSTEQLAQLYIDLNKPQYSLQDVLDCQLLCSVKYNSNAIVIDINKLTGK